MSQRPRPVSIIAWAFVGIGVASLANDQWRLTDSVHRAAIAAGGHEARDFALVVTVHALGLVAGVFMLRGANWARWLAVAWILFHVAISYGALVPLLTHTLLAAVALYFLFRPTVSAYFRPPPATVA